MANRKQLVATATIKTELLDKLKEAKGMQVSEEVLHEQRISWAFGNAPEEAKTITKDSVRETSKKIRISA